MDGTQVKRYADAIVAVGTGSDSCYIKNQIAECKTILQLISHKNKKSAQEKIEKLFIRLNTPHIKADIDLIIQKIESLV